MGWDCYYYNITLDERSKQSYRRGCIDGGLEELLAENPGWTADHIIIGHGEFGDKYVYNCPRDIVVYFHSEHDNEVTQLFSEEELIEMGSELLGLECEPNPVGTSEDEDPREFPEMILYNVRTKTYTNI